MYCIYLLPVHLVPFDSIVLIKKIRSITHSVSLGNIVQILRVNRSLDMGYSDELDGRDTPRYAFISESDAV